MAVIMRVIAGSLLLALLATGGGCARQKVRQAEHDVEQLRLALDLYLSEQGVYPTGSAAEISQLLRGHALGEQNPTKASYVEAAPGEVNEQGEFVDPWGTPYRIIIASPPRVYSCGPNKVDENGAGDDVSS